MSERDPIGWIAIIAAMAVAVYLSRAGGYWLIGRFTIGVRLRRILDALPGAIIVATVAPVLLHGGWAALSTVSVAAIVMIMVRNDFAAVLLGIAAAALVRAAGF